jgi:hypothetical protein
MTIASTESVALKMVAARTSFGYGHCYVKRGDYFLTFKRCHNLGIIA